MSRCLGCQAPTERLVPLVPFPLELQVRACATERARRSETKKSETRPKYPSARITPKRSIHLIDVDLGVIFGSMH